MLGFLRRVFGGEPAPAPRRPRGPAKSAAEREKLAELRYLQELRRRDRAEYDRIMKRRMGLDDEGDELDRFIAMQERLRRARVLKGLDSGEGSWIRDALAGLPILLQALQAQAGPAAAAPAPAEPAPAALPAAHPPHPTEAAMSLISRYLVGQLQMRTPEQAAAWLRTQTHPQAREFVARLAATPDEEVLLRLDELASVPDLHGLVAWLRARPDWLLATVRALRDPGDAPATRASMGF